MAGDVRTVDKLLDRVNLTDDDRHMWLAPRVRMNEIVLRFERMVTIGFLKLFNYGKTPERGVKEFEVLMDDHVLYSGVMRQARVGADFSTVVLFTGEREVVGEQGKNIYVSENARQAILFDEGVLVGGTAAPRRIEERPYTGMVG